MNKLEIIRKILKESKDVDLTYLLNNDDIDNLILLLSLNKKYINKVNLNYIINKGLNIKIEKLSKDFSNIPLYNANYYINLSNLISVYPNLYNKIPIKIIDEIEYREWANIISNQPQFFDNCKITQQFTLEDWSKIIEKQPHLITKYKNLYNPTRFFDVVVLLSKSKEVLNYVDISKFKFDLYYLPNMIKIYPEIINTINKNLLDDIPLVESFHNPAFSTNWLKLLEINPDLINICSKIKEFNKIYNKYQDETIKLISKQPIFKYLLPEVNKISNRSLVILIKNQPQLIEELDIDVKRLDKNNWGEILAEQPQLIDKCDKIDEIEPHFWGYILAKNSLLVKYCNKIDKLNNFDWYKILEKQPNLIDLCNEPLLYRQRIDLLELYPNLINKINIEDIFKNDFENIIYKSKEYRNEVLEVYIKNNKDPEVLTNMIGIYPDLKNLYTKNNLWKYVNFNKLNDNLEYSILK